MKKVIKFLSEYIEDLFIVIGILLIVSATFMLFGLSFALYVLGGFLIIIGVVDPHILKRGR